MSKEVLQEALGNLVDKNIAKFQSNVEDVLYAKVYDAISEARKQIGLEFMTEGPEDPEETTEEQDDNFVELTDDDLEDLFAEIADDDYFFDEDEDEDDFVGEDDNA